MTDAEFRERLLEELSGIREAMQAMDQSINQLSFNMMTAATVLSDIESAILEV